MIKKYFLFCLCLFCFSLLNAENFDNVKVVSVYDGDTFKVNLPCTQDIFCRDISVRVYGVDTPEMKTQNSCEKKKAKEAQALTKEVLSKGPVLLKNCKRDKYFRILCDVVVLGQNQGYELSEELVNNHLAVRYYGETKAEVDWCKMPQSPKKQESILQDFKDLFARLLDEFLRYLKKNL